MGNTIKVLQPGYDASSFHAYRHIRDENGNPIYDHVANFTPDLEDSGWFQPADGVALFEVPAGLIAPTTVPIDAFIPGCPPKPEAIISGVVTVIKALREGAMVPKCLGEPGRGMEVAQDAMSGPKDLVHGQEGRGQHLASVGRIVEGAL